MFTIDFSRLPALNKSTPTPDVSHSPICDWEKQVWQIAENWYTGKTQEFAVKTSGSTGLPKVITLNRQTIINSAEMTIEFLNLKSTDSGLLCLPADKIGGFMMIARAAVAGMKLHCVKPSLLPLSEVARNTEISFAAFTPLQFWEQLQNSQTEPFLHDIKTIILGGAEIGKDLRVRIKKFKNAVYQTFGMTETISHIALRKLSGNSENEYYQTLPGITISSNEENRLVIDAPLLGISNMITNDIVKIHSPTSFEWLGRADNVINTGGVKVMPEVCEDLLSNDMALPFFIVGLKDEQWGEKVVIAIEKENLTDKELDSLKEAFQILERHHRPKALLLFSQFDYTSTGKIQRRNTLQLPHRYVAIKNS